jgi:hypothetical protein
VNVNEPTSAEEIAALRTKEWTFCPVHERVAEAGSCPDCGGDRHLIQVGWTAGGDEMGETCQVCRALACAERRRATMAAKSTIRFTPVNRIGEPCACCSKERAWRSTRGVRVEADGLTFYYCDTCIGQLAKAKAHP